MALSRRRFLQALLGGAGLVASGLYLRRSLLSSTSAEPVFIVSAKTYQENLAVKLLSGFKELGVGPEEIRGKRILLKPNLVETSFGVSHINTHPLVVRGPLKRFSILAPPKS